MEPRAIPLNRPPTPSVGQLPYGYPANASFKSAPHLAHPTANQFDDAVQPNIAVPPVQALLENPDTMIESLAKDPNFWHPSPLEMKSQTLKMADQVAYRFFPETFFPPVNGGAGGPQTSSAISYPQIDRDGRPIALASTPGTDTESRLPGDAPQISTRQEAYELGRARMFERHQEVIMRTMDRFANAMPDVADALIDSALGFRMVETGTDKDGFPTEKSYTRAPDVRAGIYIIDRIIGKPTEFKEITETHSGNVGVQIYLPENNRVPAVDAQDVLDAECAPMLPANPNEQQVSDVFANALQKRLNSEPPGPTNSTVEAPYSPSHCLA